MKDILIRENGHVGHITLNRPKALNALTYDMILEIEKALISWKENTKIKLILVDSNGDKAFCSGGDVSNLYRHGVSGNYKFGKLFWADEYRLNLLISNSPQLVQRHPIISSVLPSYYFHYYYYFVLIMIYVKKNIDKNSFIEKIEIRIEGIRVNNEK